MRALKGHVIFLWSVLKQQVEKAQVKVTFSHHTDFFFGINTNTITQCGFKINTRITNAKNCENPIMTFVFLQKQYEVFCSNLLKRKWQHAATVETTV